MFVPAVYLHAYNLPKSRQGKVAELRQELHFGGKKDKNHAGKKIALKKIVANMTMSNNDMVALFPDVVGCMDIHSLEIKKMWVLWRMALAGNLESRALIEGQVLSIPCELCENEAGDCDEGASYFGRGKFGRA
jgi:hypothetical protein